MYWKGMIGAGNHTPRFLCPQTVPFLAKGELIGTAATIPLPSLYAAADDALVYSYLVSGTVCSKIPGLLELFPPVDKLGDPLKD